MLNCAVGLLHYEYVSNKTLWQVRVQGALYGNKKYMPGCGNTTRKL